MNLNLVADMSDEQLIDEMGRLSRSEREATAWLIAHLVEFDTRRLYLAAGLPSLFLYCTEVLRLSEHEAYNRIEAARVVRRFPPILDMVGEGSINLTTVRLLAPHLTEENAAGLLAEAAGKGKGDVARLLARQFPSPDVPNSIRKVPVRVAAPKASTGTTPIGPMPGPVAATAGRTGAAEMGVANDSSATTMIAEDGPEQMTTARPDAAALPAPSVRRDVVRPLALDRYEVRFTAGTATCEKLRMAKELLRHSIPNADTGEVIDRALTVLLDDLARKKFAATSQPRSKGAPVTRAGSRHIPAQVKRTVWLRDGGRCAFVGTGGRHCAERGFLEFHHLRPHAVGGPATVENIQLRCRAHNAYEAELYYGPGVREGWEPTGREGGQRPGAELVPERVRLEAEAYPQLLPERVVAARSPV